MVVELYELPAATKGAILLLVSGLRDAKRLRRVLCDLSHMQTTECTLFKLAFPMQNTDDVKRT